MAVILNGNELVLYGAVGDMLWDDSFAARDVVSALAGLRGKDVSVRINSGGGIADEGVAIYNTLKSHNGKITVYVDGVAASAASLIAMAGDKIIMRTGSVMMVHDPLIMAVGNAAAMNKYIEQLNATGDSMAEIYAKKTGRPAAEIRDEMREELWLTPAEAVAKGYADSEEDGEVIEASAFDYRAYMRTPEPIVAMSDSRSWSNRLKAHVTPTATNKKGPDMVVKNENRSASEADAAAVTVTDETVEVAVASAVAAERERVAAIYDVCAAAGTLTLAASFVRDGVTVEQAKERAEAENARVSAIRQKVDAARASLGSAYDPALADEFIASGASPEAVGNALLDKITATQAVRETRSQFATEDGSRAAVATTPLAKAVYDKRQNARAKMALVN